MRPLKAFRYLVRFGCSMTAIFQNRSGRVAAALAARFAFAPRTAAGIFSLGQPLVLRHRVVFEDLALEYPDLDAASAIGRMRGGDAVIDVGAQRVQRHPTFAVPFEPGD